MPYLNLIYKGAHSNNLYSAYFDGSTWHGNTQISDQPGGISPKSDLNPGSCLYNNCLYIVYKGAGTTDLYMSRYDGTTWYGDTKIGDQPGGINPKSDVSPSLIVFNGLMYAVYKGAGSNDIYVAWFNGTQWYGDKKIGDLPGGIAPQTNDGLDTVSYNNRLYLVYKGARSNNLHTAYFDGTTWYGDTKISDQPGGISPESNYNPGTLVYDNRLYLVYKGARSNDLHTAYFDGTTWYGDTKISDQPGGISPESNYNPGALLFNNKFYLVYKGAHSNNLYSAWYDGSTWSGNRRIGDQPGVISPECNYNPNLDFLPIPPGTMAAWLQSVPDSTLLCDINVPGTHDSAAINGWFTTPYSCHNTSLTQQLESGVRLLDIRLKVKESGSNYTFVTCHGDIGPNEYQSFPSAMQECKNFLASNPTEFIAMSLKVDDWNHTTNRAAAYGALEVLLQSYPVYSASSTMATLQQVRGRIYLLNRMNSDLALGVPVDWSDNTSGSWAPGNSNRAFQLYVQDQYNGLPTIGPEKEKMRLFKDAIPQTVNGQMLLNFASATYFGIKGVYIMGRLLSYLGTMTAADRPTRLGWSLFDYESTSYQTDVYGFLNCVQIIIASNFGYRGYPNSFKVVANGRDEL